MPARLAAAIIGGAVVMAGGAAAALTWPASLWPASAWSPPGARSSPAAGSPGGSGGSASSGSAAQAGTAAQVQAAQAQAASSGAVQASAAARAARARAAQVQADAQARAAALPVRVQAASQVATVRVAAPKYLSPGRREGGSVSPSWNYRPSVLPVIAARPGWVRVRLAPRPNGSTAWLPAADVRLAPNPDRIVINLATRHLALYENGAVVFSAPAGVGAPDDPTPGGEYFVAFEEDPPQPNPGYGPFIIVTSAHSPAISDWQASGDAVIGIHGPLGEDALIGLAGARISHGCIRLHDAALTRLRAVPPGTPIDITG
jgi:hypothetical protein